MHIPTYLCKLRDYMLIYSSPDLIPMYFIDSDSQADRDSCMSTFVTMLSLYNSTIVWKSLKQSLIVDSTMRTEYVATCDVTKEVVRFRKYLQNFEVVHSTLRTITFLLSRSGGEKMQKKQESINVENLLNESNGWLRNRSTGRTTVCKITSSENFTDPSTKSLFARDFDGHIENIDVHNISFLLRASVRFVGKCLPVK